MATLKAPLISSNQRGIVKAAINIPTRVARISLPDFGPEEMKKEMELQKIREKQMSPLKVKTVKKTEGNELDDPLVMSKLYAVLEAVADRIEMHKNIGEQRDNWNSLLLTSINSLTLSAATMAGISAVIGGAGASAIAMKLSSTVMYVAATGMLSVVNKIQPCQLAEEQRNATRLFKQLENQIRTVISVGNPTAGYVEEMMEKVLALDKAYPLPLLGGTMIEKFPDDVEPADWWPEQRRKLRSGRNINKGCNGWDGNLEEELRQTVGVLRIKDKEEYLRLDKKVLNLNKFLAVAGPGLTGLAAVGSAVMGSPCDVGGWAVGVAVVGGALGSVVNAVEHGGQVGMVFEMYRSNAGFFKMMEELIGSNLKEEEPERRENGELFEMKVALQLGRSLSELRDLAAAATAVKGKDMDEFASKLF